MAEQLSTPLSLEDLRNAIRPICERRPIARVEVFGSIANGTADADSDIDLLVEFLPTANSGLFEMGELKEELEHRLGRSVDLLSRQGVEQSRNPIRRRAILTNPITIYAR